MSKSAFVLTAALLGSCLAVRSTGAVTIDAAVGRPFGVGRIVIPVLEQTSSEDLQTEFISITDQEGRIAYPAIRYTQPLGLIRDILGVPGNGMPRQLHFHFLFRGDEPLEVTVHLPTPQTFTVVPRHRPGVYQGLLRAWWVRYKAAARKQKLEAAYTPLVETYLTSMLSARLGLDNLHLGQHFESGESLSKLLGTETFRLATLRDAVTQPADYTAAADLPVPEPIPWREAVIPDVGEDEVVVEPIAHYVPHECFYVRFAQFPNYLWLRRLLEEYGGDLTRMVMLRGTDSQLNSRIENQLGLRESSLSRILGPQVISDVVLFGRDTFLREGAAIGVMFEARNDALGPELMNQRKRRAAELRDKGATVDTVMIDGHEVSFASTPDHQLRSYYVVADRYHLVTNSHQLVKRFLQCARGEGCLGDSAEFRFARKVMPLGEENTLFVYLSRRFFEGLVSPQYQIELSRRMRVLADFELLELATRAAAVEGYVDASVDTLMDAGFLRSPPGRLSDGTQFVATDSGIVDSRRGARGSLLPIPDTPITGITRREAEQFQQVVDFHRRRWQQMDPVLVGIRRTALNDQTERVVLDCRMLPVNVEQYGVILNVFGPPSTERIKPPEDDIVAVQAYIGGDNPLIPPHHLYFGIRDASPNVGYSGQKLLKSLQVLRTAPAYIAAWPNPGVLSRIGFGGEPMGDGFSKLALGLYRLQVDDFALLSFHPKIMEDVAPELSIETDAEPAQIRVSVGNIKDSKFGAWANDLDFQRAWETSLGNVHLLHLLVQQLHVPMPEAKDVAETILNAQLICPLGGRYELYENEDGSQRWASSAWAEGKEAARKAYVSPLRNWLRGLEAQMSIEEGRVVARATLDIARAKEQEGGIKLPLFDFLNGK